MIFVSFFCIEKQKYTDITNIYTNIIYRITNIQNHSELLIAEKAALMLGHRRST